MSSLCEILFGSKKQEGIFSVCTANPVVIRSALRLAKEEGFTLAIEATANQVDQFGGYTGMRPADYAAMVEAIAADEGVPADRYILGGDHLGPLTRCGEPEEKAMPFAKELVRQYVLAGFTKIHLDTSMRLASDDQQIPLDVRVCARRGAELAEVVWQAYAERVKSAPSSPRPSLVIGSEVPIPGGSKEHEDSVAPTDPKDFLAQVQAFQEAFSAHGVSFEDVAAFVVQPGVEFGDDFVCQYSPQKAAGLMADKGQPAEPCEGSRSYTQGWPGPYLRPEGSSVSYRAGLGRYGRKLPSLQGDALRRDERRRQILAQILYRHAG